MGKLKLRDGDKLRRSRRKPKAWFFLIDLDKHLRGKPDYVSISNSF